MHLSKSGIEVVPRLVTVHRLRAYRNFDPIRRIGELVWDSGPKENLTVTVGKSLILDRLFGTGGPPAAATVIGVGTDTTAALAGQTQLNPSVAGSVFLQANDATFPQRTAQTTLCQITIGTASANFAIGEAGAFNGLVNGTSTMLNRLLVGPFTKTSAISLIYQMSYTQN